MHVRLTTHVARRRRLALVAAVATGALLLSAAPGADAQSVEPPEVPVDPSSIDDVPGLIEQHTPEPVGDVLEETLDTLFPCSSDSSGTSGSAADDEASGSPESASACMGPEDPRPEQAKAKRSKIFDEVLDDVDQLRAPGFAGYYICGDEPNEKLCVRLTNGTPPQRAEHAKQALVEMLEDPSLADLPVQIVQSQWRWKQLHAWHMKILQNLPDGVISTDNDEVLHQIVLGLTDPASDEVAVRNRVQQLGVPQDAVTIHPAEPMEELSHDGTVDGFHTPMVGGLRIQWRRNDNWLIGCTLGVPASLSGVVGFLTNSHCSNRFGRWGGDGASDFTRYGQPTLARREVGQEWFDGQRLRNAPCPLDQVSWCRYADVTFISRTAQGTRGRIAWPDNENQRTWTTNQTRRITSAAQPQTKKQVAMVGATSGRRTSVTSSVGHSHVYTTCGNVRKDNVRIETTANGQHLRANILLFCQGAAWMTGAEGDSGAPLFRRDGGEALDASLKGIVWGGGRVWDPNEQRFRNAVSFTPWNNLLQASEFGHNLRVCDQAFNC